MGNNKGIKLTCNMLSEGTVLSTGVKKQVKLFTSKIRILKSRMVRQEERMLYLVTVANVATGNKQIIKGRCNKPKHAGTYTNGKKTRQILIL